MDSGGAGQLVCIVKQHIHAATSPLSRSSENACVDKPGRASLTKKVKQKHQKHTNFFLKCFVFLHCSCRLLALDDTFNTKG